MIRYAVSRFQQRLTQPLVRAYASKGNAPKVLVPRIPQQRDELQHIAEVKPPLLPPCPHKAAQKPLPKDAKQAHKPQPKPTEPTIHDHHEATHDEVVNNIGGAPVNLLHH